MPLIALTSSRGSPGVTTTALALTLIWPRPTVLQTDPATGPSDPVIVDVLVSSEQAADLASSVATGRIAVVLTSRER